MFTKCPAMNVAKFHVDLNKHSELILMHVPAPPVNHCVSWSAETRKKLNNWGGQYQTFKLFQTQPCHAETCASLLGDAWKLKTRLF